MSSQVCGIDHFLAAESRYVDISCNFVFYQQKSNATIVLTMCAISCAGLQLKAEKDAKH
jgi:hypothetical protein